MTISQVGNDAAARCARKESFLDQERFIYFFQCTYIFTDGCGNSSGADRTAAEFFDDGQQDLIVDGIETTRIDVQGIERETRDFQIDNTVTPHLCEVTDTTQQGIGDTRRTAAAKGYFARSFIFNLYIQDTGAAADDVEKHAGVVILQVTLDAEAGTERRSEQAASRRSANQGERI